MHQLLLLRHAKSSWNDATLPDRDRPLNKRGRRAAATMRQTMQQLGLTPDLVLLSPARRTQETLAGLEPWDETPLVESVEALYLATAQQLLSALRGVNETVRSVMLIGHNPGMHELAVLLRGVQRDAEPRRHGETSRRGIPDRGAGGIRHRRAPGSSSIPARDTWSASWCRVTCGTVSRRRQRPDCMELELGLDPDDAARLPRLALLAPLRVGRTRSTGNPHGLARRPRTEPWPNKDLVIAEQRPGWRLERLRPDAKPWPPGAPAPVLAEGRDPASLGCHAPRPAGSAGGVRGARVEPRTAGRPWTGDADPAERCDARRCGGTTRQPRAAARRGPGGDRRCARARRRSAHRHPRGQPGGGGDFGHARHTAAAPTRGRAGIAGRTSRWQLPSPMSSAI